MEQEQKPGVYRVLNIVLTAAIILLMGVMIYVTVCAVQGRPAMFFGRCVMQVITGSMEPTLHVGDCILVEQVAPEALSEGDVAVYISEAADIQGMMVTHRVVQCLPDGSFIMRGDANPVEDALPVRADQIQGRYLKKVRIFTWLASFASLRKVMLAVVMLLVSATALYEVRTVMQIGKEIKDETAGERRERLIREAIEKEKARLAAENYQPEQEDTPEQKEEQP